MTESESKNGLVLVRRNALAPRVLGVLSWVAPALLAAYFFRHGGIVGILCGFGLALFALTNLRSNLAFAGRVSLDGARLTVRALWTGAERQHEVSELVEVRARPVLTPGSTPERPVAGFASFWLRFADGRALVVNEDFGAIEALMERVFARAFPGYAFTPRLGAAVMVSWVRYPHANLGASASYSAPSGGLATLFAYEGNGGPVPEGAHSPEAAAELERACADLRTANAAQSASTVETERGIVGEGTALAMQSACFTCGTGKEQTRMRVYVTGRDGVYLKVRSTQPAAQTEDAGASLVGALREAAAAR